MLPTFGTFKAEQQNCFVFFNLQPVKEFRSSEFEHSAFRKRPNQTFKRSLKGLKKGLIEYFSVGYNEPIEA